MDNKNKKIIDVSNLVNQENHIIGIDFFEEVYELTKTFKEYLSAVRQLKISYFDDVLLKFRDEIDYVVKASKEVSKLEPKKLNSVLDSMASDDKEMMLECFNNMFTSADQFYHVYFILSDNIGANIPIRSFEFTAYNRYMEELIVGFLLKATTLFEVYGVYGLKKGKKFEEFMANNFSLFYYEFDEIGRIEMGGVIRESNSAKSKILYTLEESDFFAIIDSVRLYYKVKFYDFEKDAIIYGFVLKKNVEFYLDMVDNGSELHGEKLNHIEGYDELEAFIEQYRAVYENDENMRRLVRHVLGYNMVIVRMFEDFINNLKPENSMFVVDVIDKVMRYLEDDDDF